MVQPFPADGRSWPGQCRGSCGGGDHAHHCGSAASVSYPSCSQPSAYGKANKALWASASYFLLRFPSSYADWVWPQDLFSLVIPLLIAAAFVLWLTSSKTASLLRPPAWGLHSGLLKSSPDLLGVANSGTQILPPGRESWPPVTAYLGNTCTSVPLNSALLSLQKDLSAATGKMCSYLTAGAEGRLPCSSPPLASTSSPPVMEP